MNSLVSVIIPVFNVEQYLERCVGSVMHQVYKNIEIILVDDGSTDQSSRLCDEIGKRDVRIHVIHKKNGGLSSARNTGLKYATGEWVTFIDSDDWVSQDYISGMCCAADENKADIVIGGVAYTYDNGTTKSADSYGNLNNGAEKKRIVVQCRSYACGRLFRKSLFNNIDFPEDIRRSEDIGTIIPVLTKAKKIAIYEKEVYFYYQRSTSLSLSNKNIDLSFYPKTVNRMLELSEAGFEEELEFRCVHELLYGMVYLMIVSKKNHRDFLDHVNSFNDNHKGWESNIYINELPKAKKIFIFLAGRKQYGMLKVLVLAKTIMSRGGA